MESMPSGTSIHPSIHRLSSCGWSLFRLISKAFLSIYIHNKLLLSIDWCIRKGTSACGIKTRCICVRDFFCEWNDCVCVHQLRLVWEDGINAPYIRGEKKEINPSAGFQTFSACFFVVLSNQMCSWRAKEENNPFQTFSASLFVVLC
jgi:hypothetical protein